MEIRCLLNTTVRNNVQSGASRCKKTLNQYVTKNGEQIKEVICDYGRGLTTKTEVFPNKIINTLSTGEVIEYTKNIFGTVLVKEGKNTSISKNQNIWNDLLAHVFKGF